MPGSEVLPTQDSQNHPNLAWGKGEIGKYHVQKHPKAGEQPESAKIGEYCVSDAFDNGQQRVNAYLKNNEQALAALYKVPVDRLHTFLSIPDSTIERVKFKEQFNNFIQHKPKAEKISITQKIVSESPTKALSLKTLSHLITPKKTVCTTEMPVATMEEFFGKDKEGQELYKQYLKAVDEEVNSRNYINAVFLNSMNHYEGPTLENPVYIAAGGPSGAGKSYLKEPSVQEAVAYLPKKRNDNHEIINNGNDVVSVDNGIARSTLQVGKMVLQHAFAKGYKELSDYNEITKASAKYKIKAAATEAGLSMYKPKTYPKLNAHQTVLDFANEHDGTHHGRQKYFVVATNIMATLEVVRHQGTIRSQLQREFLESEIDINNPDMPAESKRYGKLIANLDLYISFLRNQSFDTGQKKSASAAEEFRKAGIPIIEIDSTNRILVAFKEGNTHQLKQVGEDKAGSLEAFITTRTAFKKWNKMPPQEALSNTQDKLSAFKRFEKTLDVNMLIRMDQDTQAIYELQEAYAEFYHYIEAHNKIKFKDQDVPNSWHLASIEQFNHFLKLINIRTNKTFRNKLLSILQESIDESTPEFFQRVCLFNKSLFEISMQASNPEELASKLYFLTDGILASKLGKTTQTKELENSDQNDENNNTFMKSTIAFAVFNPNFEHEHKYAYSDDSNDSSDPEGLGETLEVSIHMPEASIKLEPEKRKELLDLSKANKQIQIIQCITEIEPISPRSITLEEFEKIEPELQLVIINNLNNVKKLIPIVIPSLKRLITDFDSQTIIKVLSDDKLTELFYHHPNHPKKTKSPSKDNNDNSSMTVDSAVNRLNSSPSCPGVSSGPDTPTKKLKRF